MRDSAGFVVWMNDVLDSVRGYIMDITPGWYIKAPLAFIMTVFVDIFCGDVVVFNIYAGFMVADLLLGIIYAKVIGDGRYGRWDIRKVKYFLRKVMTHFGILVLFGALSHSLFRTSGYNIAVVNWVLFMLTIIEANGILDKADRLGMPIHPVVRALLKLMRRKAARDFTTLLEDPESREELEKALAAYRAKGVD